MWMMALRVREMNDEWSQRRKESVKSVDIEEGLVLGGRTMGAALAPASEKVLNPAVNEGGLGMYESHSNCIFYRSDTQPTSSRWQIVSSLPALNKQKGRLLGGTKVGNGAWGLAWVDTIMESSSTSAREELQQRERILREVSSGHTIQETEMDLS